MRRHIVRFGLLGAVITLAFVSSSSALALPPHTIVHSPLPATSPTNTTTTGSASSSSDTEPNTNTTSTAGAGTGTSGSASVGTPKPTPAPVDHVGRGSGLATGPLKVCQGRQNAINNIMARISDRGQKQLTLFSTIATRTEAFYTSKGVTLSNYDALVADVNAKQAAAQTAVDAVKTASAGFSCDGTDPTGSVAGFQSALKAEITALQDYRTAVKNLVLGVKSVVVTTTSSTATTNGGNQ